MRKNESYYRGGCACILHVSPFHSLLTLSHFHTHAYGVICVHERGRVFAMELTMAQMRFTLAFARGSTCHDFDVRIAFWKRHVREQLRNPIESEG